MTCRFADCTLDTQLYTLQRAGQKTRLLPKVFEVLCYLIEHCDRVVSKQELCDQVWEGFAISTRLAERRWVPTFPRARYLVARPECEHWSQSENRWTQIGMVDSVAQFSRPAW